MGSRQNRICRRAGRAGKHSDLVVGLGQEDVGPIHGLGRMQCRRAGVRKDKREADKELLLAFTTDSVELRDNTLKISLGIVDIEIESNHSGLRIELQLCDDL